MKGMLALVLDRATSATVSRINYEIGHDVRHSPHHYKGQVLGRWRECVKSDYDRALDEYTDISAEERRAIELGRPSDYECLLKEYVELKLYLHSLRRSMYYPYDVYAERDGDYAGVLDRCREIRAKVKELRGNCQAAAWGDFAPEPAPTVNDKPLLHAMEDHQCSYLIEFDWKEDHWVQCQIAGEHWYRGLPYCRSHQGQARRDAKAQRRQKQQEARRKHQVAYQNGEYSVEAETPKEPCTYRDWTSGSVCGRKFPHSHYGGRVIKS